MQTIRLATLDDLEPLYRLCASFYHSSEYSLPLDQAYGSNYIRNHIPQKDNLSLVLEDQGQLVGCLLAISGPHPFFPVRVSTELVWWVEPEFRGKSSLDLLKAFEYWSVELQKCNLICITSHTDDPRLAVYYKRMKYIPKELSWYKTIRKEL